VIIRILGEGQRRVDDSVIDELHRLDDVLEAAVESNDEAAFHPALEALLSRARAAGTELPADAIEPSELILPSSGASMDEVRKLLTDAGHLT
jgi:hypothetical protein